MVEVVGVDLLRLIVRGSFSLGIYRDGSALWSELCLARAFLLLREEADIFQIAWFSKWLFGFSCRFFSRFISFHFVNKLSSNYS